MVERVLQGGEVIFDEGIKVVGPSVVEDQAQVPETADARGLSGVYKIIVFAIYAIVADAFGRTVMRLYPSFRSRALAARGR
ncbi:hypothetical protein [Hyphomicrobium sp. CS1GBMeth3]|uniref:hypothetical protein n=1 Tax=Hyphomicrobium sp. CS1GBMeth3 TaxID=1892845 RepID=UPI001114A372|nr:hypothetical protein [Hyphomicrobium sp. CS1GBMeth3]